MSVKIVIVEDEEDLLELLEYNLSKEGYEVIGFLNTKTVEQILEEEDIDLLIMDRNLPGVEGSEFVEGLRKDGIITPVIYLSAKNRDSDIEEGFLRGGDDYLTKPFSIKELLARANAFLRRKRCAEPKVYRFGNCVLDIDARTFMRDSKEIKLSPKEFKFLEFILGRQGRALTRDEILNAVWGYNNFVTHRSIDRCVATLRSKIEPNPENPIYIHTLRQIGYKFEQA
jgi:two-component system alkaline phosphatase synthesis response regulator PhoP